VAEPASAQTALPPVAQRHRAAAERRKLKLAKDRGRGAPAEVIARHEAAIARLTQLEIKAIRDWRRAARRAEQAALRTRQRAEAAVEQEAAKAEHAVLEARLARTFEAERGAIVQAATVVAQRIKANTQRDTRRRGRTTPGDRHRASDLRRSPPTARRTEIEERPVILADPSAPGEEICAILNRRVDILEYEKAHHRITEQQYCLGRIVQAVFERASGRIGSGGFNAGSRVDQVTANELRMIYAVDDARRVSAFVERIARALGPLDTRLLRQILGERLTFAQCAAARGRAGRQGTAYYADRFRDALSALVEAWAAKGRAQVDATGERRISGQRAAPTGEETDAAGIVVPPGHGEAWGVDQIRYAIDMNPDARHLSEGSTPIRDRVSVRAALPPET